MASNFGFPAAYEKYNTQFAGEKEIIGAMLWDTQTYTSGTTTALTFFNAVRANLSLGNLRQAGALPAPSAFLVRSFRFYVKHLPRVVARAASGNIQAGAIDNVAQLINNGVWTFTVASKVYAIVPLWKITAGGGIEPTLAADGDVASAGAIIDYAQNGVLHARNAFVLARPLFLAPQINFSVTLTWPAAITLAGGDTDITVALEGDLVRPVQ
jgi:hypothetical protein